MGARLEDVEVIEGDSKLAPWGLDEWASRSTGVIGGAIIRACEQLRAKVLRIAAHLLKAGGPVLSRGKTLSPPRHEGV